MKIVRRAAVSVPPTRRTGTFTGEVWSEPLLPPTDGVLVNRVSFAPSSRTYWHRHEHGQLLLVDEGDGWVGVRGEAPERLGRGDLVWSPPGETHWHGSGVRSPLVHTAIALGETAWLDEVAQGDLGEEPARSGSRYDDGLQVRREVMGPDFVDRALGGTSEFARPLQELVTESVWGALWTREGLDRRTRSLVVLGMLTALGRSTELAGHVRGALRNGCTEQEVQEALLQTLGYCGAPAALEAFRVAERVLAELQEQGLGEQ